MRICIDPGHGGIDSGAPGPTGLKECNVTLAVALMVAPLLEAAGIQVIMTRTAPSVPWAQDSARPGLDLHARAVVANDNKADLFLSIHCDSFSDHSAHGTTGFCLAFGGNGEKLARAVKNEVVKAIGTADRGIQAANFQVLRDTDMSAALVEMAFISNPGEERLLAGPATQQKLAVAIAKGICGFYGVQFGAQASPAQAATVSTSVSEWARASWPKAVTMGIMDGTDPQGTVTREQLAVALDKLGLLK